MNLVSGKSAGVFSGLTCQLAWMLVAENPNNELNLQLHTLYLYVEVYRFSLIF